MSYNNIILIKALIIISSEPFQLHIGAIYILTIYIVRLSLFCFDKNNYICRDTQWAHISRNKIISLSFSKCLFYLFVENCTKNSLRDLEEVSKEADSFFILYPKR